VPGFHIDTGPFGQFGVFQPAATIELARQHRWRFATLEPLQGILIYARKSGRPKPEIDRATLHHMQDCIYFPGKQKWLPIEITFYHVFGTSETGDVAKQIYKWWSTEVIDLKTSKINLKKKTCTLELVDGSGVALYKYTMYGCWISKVTPDELDYTSTKLGEITFTLEMDKATEELLEGSPASNTKAAAGGGRSGPRHIDNTNRLGLNPHADSQSGNTNPFAPL